MAGRFKRIIFEPFQKFFQLQTSGGILLLIATAVALFWANSPWGDLYEELWHLNFGVRSVGFTFERTLHFWINDGLMTIFFLVVGLEIKRELWVGELSTRKKAVLPFMAALGGMIFPALIYMAIAGQQNPLYVPGWGIPTVTDIAFAIGILAILGSRAPLGLKVFLTALAIIDDLGAILLIVVFYSAGIDWMYLAWALLLLLALLALNRLRVYSVVLYCLAGVLLWGLILKSGLHATVSGVLLAFVIPSQSLINPADFWKRAHLSLDRFQKADAVCEDVVMLTNDEHQSSVQELELLCERVQSPLQKLEHTLHPFVGYFILPVFALANAGVHFPESGPFGALIHPIGLAIILGLFFGKQIGITLFSWLSVRLGLAELPEGVGWSAIYGASILGGIGFTMSLFISVLAFSQEAFITDAKMGVLWASLLSGLVGVAVLWRVLKKTNTEAPEG